MATPDKKTTEPEEPPSFEDALGRIEAIVAELEDDEIPLDELITKYEEGIGALEVCDARLEAVRQRISQLEKTAPGDGVPAVSPFTDTGSPANES